jgi:plastocyanin
MDGAKALAFGSLILAIVCVAPAISAAQDGGIPTETATAETATTTTAAPVSSADPSPPGSTESEGVEPGGDQAADRGEGAPQQADVPEPSGAAISSRSPGRARAAATTRVNMGDFFFSPATVSIAVGDTVTWRNIGHEPHTATADDGSFDTGVVVAGQRSSRIFSKAGTFTYVCTIHPNMKGTVRVSGGGAGGTAGGGGAGASAGPGPSEADAVKSPKAAGDSDTLPTTGMAAGALGLVGLALLASGLITRYGGGRTTASAVATITVERKAGVFTHSLRKYKVLVDGQEVGRVGDGETLSTDVRPGAHEVQLKLDWGPPPSVSVNVSGDEEVRLFCEPAANAFIDLYYSMFARKRYIKLRQA